MNYIYKVLQDFYEHLPRDQLQTNFAIKWTSHITITLLKLKYITQINNKIWTQ